MNVVLLVGSHGGGLVWERDLHAQCRHKPLGPGAVGQSSRLSVSAGGVLLDSLGQCVGVAFACTCVTLLFI